MVANLTIIRNPATDIEFEQAVNNVVAEGVLDPAVLQRRLRERYPRAVVRPRDLSGEGAPVWYVYRDGRWVRE